jgi:hypothetical protein
MAIAKRSVFILSIACLGATALSVAFAEPQPGLAVHQNLKAPSEFESIGEPGERSRAIFAEIGKLLTHPRCMGCHPAGVHPLQGADHHEHRPTAWRSDAGNLGTNGRWKGRDGCAIVGDSLRRMPARMPVIDLVTWDHQHLRSSQSIALSVLISAWRKMCFTTYGVTAAKKPQHSLAPSKLSAKSYTRRVTVLLALAAQEMKAENSFMSIPAFDCFGTASNNPQGR